MASYQPRTPGLLPKHSAAAKTVVQAGNVTPQNLGCIEFPPVLLVWEEWQRGVIVNVESFNTNTFFRRIMMLKLL